MKQVDVFIVDDEEGARTALQQIIHSTSPELNVVGLAANVDKAHEEIVKLKPRVVFLDIHLQERSGFDLLERNLGYKPEIVFVTAYDDYAIEAFKRHALSYLLKPFTFDEFRSVRDRILEVIGNEISPIQKAMPKLLQHLRDKVGVPVGTSTEYLEQRDILYVEAQGNYAKIHLTHRRPIVISKTLRFMEERLSPDRFMRAHRSFLVNIEHVIRWEKSHQGSLVLSNDASIPLSKEGRSIWLTMQE